MSRSTTRLSVRLLCVTLSAALAMSAHAAGDDAAPAAASIAPASDGDIAWHGERASMTALGDGKGYVLHGPFGTRAIPAPKFAVQTASPMFDGLFAMAQADLQLSSVTAIRDGAFDHGQPIPCTCFETGAKWPYVWTRDLSYAIDLGVWRFDPERAVNGLTFKLSGTRAKDVPPGTYVMQDTGSGGSWPISTDRVVWFLAARHLARSPFGEKVYAALTDTLAQNRSYAFDRRFGLYRGETSFLDWREQTYPAWTADDVDFIAQSYALSTNVLHYEALTLAAQLAAQRHDDAAHTAYTAQAQALKQAINAHFWRADSGMYMSYIGGDGLPVETYDLLGIALAITSGVADEARSRSALAHYPIWPAGSPVIWPGRADQPIYHNRAIWPFVSAYALRAARAVDAPGLIGREIDSLMRGAALAGSNMENFELATQAVHVDDGKLSGPVVNSPRQLWSIAAYLDMVTEGVFGAQDDGDVAPKIPVALVPMLFGDQPRITLQMPGQRIVLRRPDKLDGNLLVTGHIEKLHGETDVQLRAIHVDPLTLTTDAPSYAPPTPAAPSVTVDGTRWTVSAPVKGRLYENGKRLGDIDGTQTLAATPALACFRVTTVGADGIESLPSPAACAGTVATVGGAWPRQWKAAQDGTFRVALDYDNRNGPINTGVTAGVKRLQIACGSAPAQEVTIVMPHSVREEPSTWGTFAARDGDSCRFTLAQGFNMSDLANFAHFTGGQGGASGPLNEADVGAMKISPWDAVAP